MPKSRVVPMRRNRSKKDEKISGSMVMLPSRFFEARHLSPSRTLVHDWGGLKAISDPDPMVTGNLNNILPLNLRKKLALHCNNVYFCPQFEVDTYGNLRMTSVSDWCPSLRKAAGMVAGIFLGQPIGATNFVVLHNESK